MFVRLAVLVLLAIALLAYFLRRANRRDDAKPERASSRIKNERAPSFAGGYVLDLAMRCLCASCEQEVAATPDDQCEACGQPYLLDGRYQLEARVGHGTNAVTYRARRIDNLALAAIKELSVRKIDSFKALEHFEREAKVLASLDHPGIPSYVERFTTENGRFTTFYLAEEFIAGKTLLEEMATHRHTEAQVVEIIDEIQAILDYLHGLVPPVIHRDIKPSNIMRRQVDGRLFLIDFGSVRELTAGDFDASTAASTAASTVAGTFGYMAPEQFAGMAVPASDVYGLGATAVALLARQDVCHLLTAQNTLDWQPHVQVSAATQARLRTMLETDVNRRTQALANHSTSA
ncbi:MAG: serine/threonine protein kinase [Bradymonadaceae bacterium]|nr:serine/threonine protein kinase [Lujinxingiaceae bacterium]